MAEQDPTEPSLLNVFNVMPGNTLVVLPDVSVYTIVAVTDNFLKLFGVERAAVLQQPLVKALPLKEDTDVFKELQAAISECIAAKQSTFIHHTLGARSFVCTCKPVLHTSGDIQYLLITIKEIGGMQEWDAGKDKALLETALNASDNGLTIIKSIRDSSGVITDFRYEWVNRKGIEIAGMDITGYTLGTLYPEVKNASWFKDIITTVETGASSKSEHNYVVNGIEYWFRYTATKLDDGAFHITENITNHKQAEQQLKESREQLQSIFNSVDIIIMMFSAVRNEDGGLTDLRYTALNTLAQQYEEGNPVGELYAERHPGIKQTVMFGHLSNVIETGNPADFELFYSFENVPASWYRIKAVKVGDGLVLVGENVLTRKKEEAALRESNLKLQYANENLQQFTSVATHDLQEPLRKIKTFASILSKQFLDDLPEEGRSVVNKIRVASDRMSKLIREVRSYSAVAYGVNAFSPTDLNSIIKDVAGDLELLLEETHTTVKQHGSMPVIEAVPLHMHQLFANLFTNAIKYRQQGTSPEIHIFCNELSTSEAAMYPNLKRNIGYVEIIFKDNGIGFEQVYAEQIFQMFERLHSNDEYEGTGIGLALCKKIIENHYGHIYAKAAPGNGAAFHVLLPLNQ